MKRRLLSIFIIICLFFALVFTKKNINTQAHENNIDELNDFTMRVNNVHFENDISINGFSIIQDQICDFLHEEFGEIKIIPAIDTKYNLIVLFFAENNENIIFKTYELECNFLISGQVKQSAKDISTFSFLDLNGDELEDIIIMFSCTDENSKNTFNVGDVLFQNGKGFYRDFRISDKVNRFDMNKNVYAIRDYVKYGKSTEFLYTSETLRQLTDRGFNVIKSQSFDVHLEKFGVVKFIPGYYTLAGQNYLMIYLINSDENILWNFQPMHAYTNYISIKACSFMDINGDGFKDIIILADYVDNGGNENVAYVTDFNIYYQEAGYFIEDTEFKNSYTIADVDSLPDITLKARQFWGWE